MTPLAGAPPTAPLPPLAESLSREYLLHHRVCPRLLRADGALVAAVAPDALVPEATDDLAIAYQLPIVPEDARRDAVEWLIERLTTQADREMELARAKGADTDALTADVRDLAAQPPVVRYVNLLVRVGEDDAPHDGAAPDSTARCVTPLVEEPSVGAGARSCNR